MKTGSLVSISSSASGEYTFPVDINLTGISEGNYTLNSEITGAGSGYSLGHKFVIKNLAPVWTASSYNTGLTIQDNDDNPIVLKDLASVSSDSEGDEITYSIVSISYPSGENPNMFCFTSIKINH
jgi:hypothetical protein